MHCQNLGNIISGAMSLQQQQAKCPKDLLLQGAATGGVRSLRRYSQT
jgi:hypothetical protein